MAPQPRNPPLPRPPGSTALRLRLPLREPEKPSRFRQAFERRRIAYLQAISLDLTLRHSTDRKDPALRQRLDNHELTFCDPEVRGLDDTDEASNYRCIARLATGVFRWHLDPSLPKSAWPERERAYWEARVLDSATRTMGQHLDMADFHAIAVLRMLFLFSGQIPRFAEAAFHEALLGMKYWLDEPPSPHGEHMTYWSENHTIAFASAEYLAGQLHKDAIFPTAGISGREHMRRARPRILRWLQQRLRWGYCEWMSPGYYDDDLSPLLNLVDFAEDPELRNRAAMAVDLLLFDLCRLHAGGSFGLTAGRAYSEHKCCAWQESPGDVIELCSGARGAFFGWADSAVALATSTRYEVPDVLLAIATNRPVQAIERARVSIDFAEAHRYGIGFSKEEDITYWWSLGAYFAPPTFDSTCRVAADRGLSSFGPFQAIKPSNAILKSLRDCLQYLPLAAEAVLPLIAPVDPVVAGASLTAATALLPFALTEAAGFVRELGQAIAHLFGADDDDGFDPDTFQRAWTALLREYGPSPLTRANLYVYRHGSAMLSSAQSHCPGQIAAQKQAWEATLGMRASVWTTRPAARTGTAASWQEGLAKTASDFNPFNIWPAVFAAILPALADTVWRELGHDGPNYWAGSVTLPMVVQHESALVAIYDPTPFQRLLAGPMTHAWFPRARFDEIVELGNWNFGRIGNDYLGLWSACRPRWVRDGVWKDKEIVAEGWRHVWICQLGSADQYGSFAAFIRRLTAASLRVTGIPDADSKQASASPIAAAQMGFIESDLTCTYAIPRGGGAPDALLRVAYGQGATVDGRPLLLDEYPRFDSPFAQVAWEQHRYRISHLDFQLQHNIDLGIRSGHGIRVDRTR